MLDTQLSLTAQLSLKQMGRPLSVEQLAALRIMPLGDVPNRLKLAIALAGCQQADIVAETNLQPSQLSKIATGKTQSVDVEIANTLADYFGCNVQDLFPSRAA